MRPGCVFGPARPGKRWGKRTGSGRTRWQEDTHHWLFKHRKRQRTRKSRPQRTAFGPRRGQPKASAVRRRRCALIRGVCIAVLRSSQCAQPGAKRPHRPTWQAPCTCKHADCACQGMASTSQLRTTDGGHLRADCVTRGLRSQTSARRPRVGLGTRLPTRGSQSGAPADPRSAQSLHRRPKGASPERARKGGCAAGSDADLQGSFGVAKLPNPRLCSSGTMPAEADARGQRLALGHTGCASGLT